jgi:hypothetical protein
MLAPIRLANAAAQLVLRTQVRRKETHPHRSRPYGGRKPVTPGPVPLLLYSLPRAAAATIARIALDHVFPV